MEDDCPISSAKNHQHYTLFASLCKNIFLTLQAEYGRMFYNI